MLLGEPLIRRLLERTGELLTERGEAIEVAAIGGASMLLLGLIKRATADLDVIGVIRNLSIQQVTELPEPLARAARDIAFLESVPANWLNVDPASIVEQGLPEGFFERCSVVYFSGLTLYLASRADQIWLKLHAAVDHGDPRGKHARDLEALHPSRAELEAAARVCVEHDPSAGFEEVLIRVLAHYGATLVR